MHWFKITIVCLLFTVIALHAADTGSNGMAFLKIDVDGRAAAMGGAYTAIATDAGAAYWNPAGLANAGHKSLVLMHNIWIADISQEFAALQIMQGKHNLAFSINLMTIGGIEIRGETPTAEPLGETEALNFYAALSYARTFFDNWQVGFSFKYLYEKYYLEMAPGWAVDIGIQRRALLKDLDWGLSIQNIGQMSKVNQVKTILPLMIRSGLSYKLPYQILDRQPFFSGDLQYIDSEGLFVRFGAEFDILEYLALRGGFILGRDERPFTTGFGLNLEGYHLDYAFVPFRYNLGYTHRISLGMNF